VFVLNSDISVADSEFNSSQFNVAIVEGWYRWCNYQDVL